MISLFGSFEHVICAVYSNDSYCCVNSKLTSLVTIRYKPNWYHEIKVDMVNAVPFFPRKLFVREVEIAMFVMTMDVWDVIPPRSSGVAICLFSSSTPISRSVPPCGRGNISSSTPTSPKKKLRGKKPISE